jgi:hypothetical protein
MRDDGEGRPPEAPGLAAWDLTEATVDRRLNRLSTVCAVPAAAALAMSGAIIWMTGAGAAEGWLSSPPTASFLMAVAALLLVLLSSAARARILRRAREDGIDEPSGFGGWLRVYARATFVCFAMLGTAVALGGTVALRGRAPFYGLVVCLASLLCMAVRWPRRAGLDVVMDGKGSAISAP